MRTLARRSAVAALALMGAGLIASHGLAAAAPAASTAEMALGDPKAKVTVIEWGSVTCSHCARFNAEVFPAFKKKYIDSGQVRFVFRELLTQPEQVSAAGFMIARCAGPSKYFAVTDAIFRSQEEMYGGGDVLGILKRVGRANGLSDEQVVACISDREALAALNARVEKASTVDGIQSTPTFQVSATNVAGQAGATKVAGVQSLAQLDALIQPLLKK